MGAIVPGSTTGVYATNSLPQRARNLAATRESPGGMSVTRTVKASGRPARARMLRSWSSKMLRENCEGGGIKADH